MHECSIVIFTLVSSVVIGVFVSVDFKLMGFFGFCRFFVFAGAWTSIMDWTRFK